MERLEVAEATLATARSGPGAGAGRPASGPRSCATTRWPTSPTAPPGTRPRAARSPGGISGTAAGALRPDPHADRQHRRGDAQGPPVPGLPASSCTATSCPPSATPTRTRSCAARTAAGSWCAPPSPGCEPPARRRGGRRVAGQPRAGRLRRARAGRRHRRGARRAGGLGRAGDQQRRRVRRPGRRAAGGARPRPDREVEVRMDSKLVVEQMSGRWQIKHPDMKQLALQAAAARPAARRRPLHLGAARAERRRRRAGQQRDGRQAGAPRRRRGGRRRSRTTCSRPPSRRRWSPRSRTCCGTGRPSTRPSAGSAAATTCRCRAPAGPRPRRPRRGPAELGIEVVVASPLRRTRETAEIVAAALGLPVRVRRRPGRAGLRRPGGPDRRRGARRTPAGHPPVLGRRHVAAPGGESMADVRARVARARRRDPHRARRAGRCWWSATSPRSSCCWPRGSAPATRSCTGCSSRRRRCARSPGRPTAAPRCAW